MVDISFKQIEHSRICSKCGQSKPITNFARRGPYRGTVCRKCLVMRYRAIGLCRCHNPVVKGKTRCEQCLHRQRVNKHRRLLKDREAALTHYGARCSYCGEYIEPFLTIDHMNNDGAEHRRKLRAGGHGGHEPCAWLRKNGYPVGFQILCFNCNAAKDKLGEEQLLTKLLALGRLSESGIGRLQCVRTTKPII